MLGSFKVTVFELVVKKVNNVCYRGPPSFVWLSSYKASHDCRKLNRIYVFIPLLKCNTNIILTIKKGKQCNNLLNMLNILLRAAVDS